MSAEDNNIEYKILKSNQEYDEDPITGTSPHGIEDVVSMVRSIREETDAKISVGDTYMAGDGIIACTGIQNSDNDAQEGTPWRPTTEINGVPMYEGIERTLEVENKENVQETDV